MGSAQRCSTVFEAQNQTSYRKGVLIRENGYISAVIKFHWTAALGLEKARDATSPEALCYRTPRLVSIHPHHGLAGR